MRSIALHAGDKELSNNIYISYLENSRSNNIYHRKYNAEEISTCSSGKKFRFSNGREAQIINKSYDDIAVTESKVCITNTAEESVELTSLGSAFIEVENRGKKSWFSHNKYLIHYCHNCWLGEGQWRKATLEDLGLYQDYNGHGHYCTVRFTSQGSQSTNRYYPLIFIEDTETGHIHYFEMKPAGGWYIEIGAAGQENGGEGLYVYLSGCCEANDGWHKTLKPGECYVTPSALWGSVEGGFEEAVRELIKFKRRTSAATFKNNIPPVCFNDYMNCCWAMPETARTIPLIDAAADAGAEIFCIDAGWHTNYSDDSMLIGDWIPSKERFVPYGLEGIAAYVKEKGMKFGVWLEIEGCVKQALGYTECNEQLLRRRGKVIGDSRAFYDFRSEVICKKIEGVFDYLYGIGVRYVKNDYNQTVGLGCDGADSLSEGLAENTKAFYRFVDYIREKYPDMIIENCGSGAMRSDAEALSHFHLQSISDQEVYTCNPSIISGSLAQIPPEKAGIWSYPYPIRYRDRLNYDKFKESVNRFSDGQETIFNMVNSMMGVMYLSGCIELADEKNRSLISEAVQVYKEYRRDISLAHPVYPSGMIRLSDRGVYSAGLLVLEKKRIYLAVWQIADVDGDTENVCREEMNKNNYIELSKYGTVIHVEKMYPSLENYRCEKVNTGICVNLPSGNSAAFISVTFE